MIAGDVSRRARELAIEGSAFVTATVVRAQRPTSAQAGNVALVLGDGTIEGFVGGVCAEHTVRVYALKAIETGEPLLLRIVPDAPVEVASEEGAVTVLNTCLSGGAIEIFLNPVLPTPRVLVVGTTPIAAALMSLGAELGLDPSTWTRAPPIHCPAISRSWSPRTGATSCTPFGAGSRRGSRTSASWPAPSAAPA